MSQISNANNDINFGTLSGKALFCAVKEWLDSGTITTKNILDLDLKNILNDKSDVNFNNKIRGLLHKTISKNEACQIIDAALMIEGKLIDDGNDRSTDPDEEWYAEQWFDPLNGAVIDTNGSLYKLKRDNKGEIIRDFVTYVGIKLIEVVALDDEIPCIRFSMDATVYTLPYYDARKMLQTRLSLTSGQSNLVAACFKGLIDDAITQNRVLREYSPVYVDHEGIIHIKSAGTDIYHNLKILQDFHQFASNQQAFLASMSYALTSPLHYRFRQMTPVGFILPMLIFDGRTGGGKTSLLWLFAGVGFNQEKSEVIIPKNSVKTVFTATHKLSENKPLAVFNDVSTEWLGNLSEELKNGAESGTFGERGRSDQSINVYELRRPFAVTLNQQTYATDDSARARRDVHVTFTEEHRLRGKKYGKEWDVVISQLEPGFLYDFIREIFDDADIDGILNEIKGIKDSTEFINYGITKINALSKKYNVAPFPLFSDKIESVGTDSFELLVDFILQAWSRLQEFKNNGRGPYPQFDEFQIYVDNASHAEENQIIVGITAAAYSEVSKRLDLPHKKIADLLQNYVENPNVVIMYSGQRHTKWVKGSAPKFYMFLVKGGDGKL